ncbi:MAG: DUF1772 domain-containing protein [Maribacter sp.]
MAFTIENTAIIALVLLTGLSAGLCFTWTNAITPGIGRLDDFGYLQSFQQMNRTILNPTFFIVFFGPLLLGIINLFVMRGASSSFIWLLGFAVLIYFLGVVLVTIFGNVPLNGLLDNTDLGIATIDELRQVREKFEIRWNRLHSIRTFASFISFLLLIISLSQNIKTYY